MGFEYMARFASSAYPTFPGVLSHLVSKDESLKLAFKKPAGETLMFENYNNDRTVTETVFSQNEMTYNHHNWGISPDAFVDDKGLAEFYEPTTVSVGKNSNDTFVATMEHKKYPFMGTQFHPEKVGRIFNGRNIDQS